VYHGTFFELGECGEVEVGSYCTIVGAVIRTNRRVVIEDYALVSHEVVIADSVAPAPPYGSEELADPALPATSVTVRRNAWVGARAILLGGADVGEGAIVGAGAVINFAVPAFSIVAGNPARVVGGAQPRDQN
jgi:acetyltransferase-like isoleucine patch superfamily enzyme